MGRFLKRGGAPGSAGPSANPEALLAPEQIDRLIRRECARADRNGREFSLVLFKVKSDRRPAVSTQRLARTMLSRARLTDEVGWLNERYLCALLPDTPIGGAEAFSEGVCDLVGQRGPRPLAVVYGYPGATVPSKREPAAQTAEHGEERRHRSGDGVGSRARSNGNGNHNGHNGAHQGAHEGAHQGTHQGTHNGNHSGNLNGNGSHKPAPSGHRPETHSNGNGGTSGFAPAEAPTATDGIDAVHASPADHAMLQRSDLLPFFTQGLRGAMDQQGLPVGSLHDFLVHPMPAWKRAVDILGASVALILASPVMLAAAAAIKLTSPGPVIFRQRRAGLGGQPFTILKFRTMVTDAEARKKDLRKYSEQDGPAFKMSNDPRITRVGRFLRNSSIDEIPQLINVLRGDMSLVGPRPLPLEEANGCLQWQRRRLDITPGLTCIWQVKGRSTVSFADWVRMDVEYARRRTLVHDISIMLRTIPAVLRRKGAR